MRAIKGMPTKDIKKRVSDIQNLVNQGLDYKQIANRLRLDLGFVMAMVKTRNIKPVAVVADQNDKEVKTGLKEEPYMNREMRRKMKKHDKKTINNSPYPYINMFPMSDGNVGIDVDVDKAIKDGKLQQVSDQVCDLINPNAKDILASIHEVFDNAKNGTIDEFKDLTAESKELQAAEPENKESTVVVEEVEKEVEMETETVETTKDADTSSAKVIRRKRITVQKANKVKEAINNGEKASDIVEKFEISWTSYYRIKEGICMGRNKKRRGNYNKKSVASVVKPDIEEVVAIATEAEEKKAEEAAKEELIAEKKANEAKVDESVKIENQQAVESNDSIVTIKDSVKFDDFHSLFGLENIDNLSEVESVNTVEAGLVADRHDMPVHKFIFQESLSEELMFDYTEQERICNSFIDANFTFENGKANEALVLYVTGYQSSLAAVIKVCYDRNIGLVLKHYNARSKEYISQYISLDPTASIDSNISDAIKYVDRRMSHGIFFYKSFAEEYNCADDTFYLLTLVKVAEDDAYSERCGVICKNYSEIWELYPTLIKQINYVSDTKLAIFVTSSFIRDGKFCFGNNITKGYNFK